MRKLTYSNTNIFWTDNVLKNSELYSDENIENEIYSDSILSLYTVLICVGGFVSFMGLATF